MHWRWRDIEPLRRARRARSRYRGRRAPRAHPRQSCLRRRDGHDVEPDRRVHRAQPGDKAVPHRHTAAAIRFATRAEGAVTIVNGRRCEMKEGDLVLTPPMCWHGHINECEHRTVWFDAANMPADLRGLDASFFEPGDATGRATSGRLAPKAPPSNTVYPWRGNALKCSAYARVGADGATDVRVHTSGRRLCYADFRPVT